MGVTGLWTVLDPGARPVKLEALAKKRLAVDASIWIYQFLKAVRDKEGNVLRNSHIVGFFRRICKLLFHGIRPVFVFDGVAPELKKLTLRKRKAFREGGRVDVVKTAGKILAVQMRKRAIEDAERQRAARENDGEEVVPDNPVYFNEVDLPQPEIQKTRFKRQDQYHLPDMSTSLDRQGGINDPRIMTQEELQAYAEQFDSAKGDMNLLDFAKIDFDSDFFASLPVADQYSILNAARLRSRLRMGLSVEQLTDMFPDRMAFSRFQVERVKERSDLTNRLMNLNGMNEVGAQRIASDKGREYILVKNEDADGGWSLGVVNTAEKPIEIDKEEVKVEINESSSDEEGAFEDVPLPVASLQKQTSSSRSADEMIRYALEQTRLAQLRPTRQDDRPRSESNPSRRAFQPHRQSNIKTNSPNKPLFTRDDSEATEQTRMARALDIWRDGNGDETAELEADEVDEDEQLRLAMKMSMETPGAIDATGGGFVLEDDDDVDDEGSLAKTVMQAASDESELLVQDEHQTQGQRPLDKIRKALADKAEAERIDVQTPDNAELRQVQKALKQKVPTAASKEDPPWFKQKVDKMPELKGNAAIVSRDEVDLTDESSDPFANAPKLLHQQSKAISIDSPGKTQAEEAHIEIDSSSDSEPGSAATLPNETSVHEEDPEPDAEPLAVDTPVESVSADAAVEDRASDDESDFEDVPVEPPPTALGDAPVEDLEVNSSTPTRPGSPTWSDADQDNVEAEESRMLDEEDQNRLQEEHELVERIQAEAEEYARFSRQLNAKNASTYSSADYENDLKQLKAQQKKNLRDADEVTQVMVQECQELLAHFGIPYIEAPQEAEAQCAELVRLELVDGIVTDDSDVFLFGGTRVYKNMFNAAKTVECFVLSDLEREFELDREKLIKLAYLLGSDYTDGIKKVGPVTAIELISDFPGENGLHDFKDWIDRVQTFTETQADKQSAFRRKFRKTAEKLVLPDNFPNPQVHNAYTKPEVDHDPSAFEWGQPDLDALRGYLMRQIGWTQDRTDEQLLPVIRDMYRKQTEGQQRNLTDFFSGSVGTGGRQGVMKPISSTRMHNALNALKRGDSAADAPVQKRSVRSKKGNVLTKPLRQGKRKASSQKSSSKRVRHSNSSEDNPTNASKDDDQNDQDDDDDDDDHDDDDNNAPDADGDEYYGIDEEDEALLADMV
ncbi:DNA repair protein rad2 [Savitreella phatthalungensis]